MALPPDLVRTYDDQSIQKGIAFNQRPYYHKWLRFYLGLCQKRFLLPSDPRNLPYFDEKLRSKNQADFQRRRARHAVTLYQEILAVSGRREPRQALPKSAQAERQAQPGNSDQASSLPPPLTATLQTIPPGTAPPEPVQPGAIAAPKPNQFIRVRSPPSQTPPSERNSRQSSPPVHPQPRELPGP